MFYLSTFKKIWATILSNKLLRILFILNIVFVAILVIFFVFNQRFGHQIEVNQQEITKNEQSLVRLQQILLNQEGAPEIDLSQTKVFAEFEEVIPFISLLEDLFLPIDPESQISIKTREDQIFIDHFADYVIISKVGNKGRLLQALKQLQDSRFILKLINFNIIYKPNEVADVSELDQIELTLRLYLK